MAEEKDKAGLTSSDKDIVRNTWDLVKKDLPGNGTDLFIRFFTEYPDNQHYFKSFKKVPISELKGNKKLLAHASNVMYAITMLVDNIEDTELLVEMLNKLAKNHARRRITIDKFTELKSTFLGFLRDKLGSELINDEAVGAWDKTFEVIISVVGKGLEESDE